MPVALEIQIQTVLVSRGASSGGEEKKEEGVSKTTYMSVLPDL